MKKFFSMALALVMILSLVACGGKSPTDDSSPENSDAAGEPVVLKFSDCHSPTAVNHLALQVMADHVEEATNGAVKIEVYPSSQLGDVAASQEAVQMNTIDMAVTNLAVMGSVIPEFGAVGGPFLFENDEHIDKALKGELGDYYKEAAKEKNMNICGYLLTGFRHTFTSKPITCIDDFKGMKIRVMENPVDVGIFNSIGAQATPMAYSELFTAIQQGTVDGGENTVANYVSDGFTEVAPNLTLSGHTYNVCVILASNDALEKVPAELRDTFVEACAEGIDMASEYVLNADKEAMEELKKMGGNIYEIDREAMYEMCTPLLDKFAGDRMPPELLAMVEAAK